MKQTKIGKLPKNWKISKIGEIAEVKGGKRLPKGEKFSEIKTSYPYIRVSDFKNGVVEIADLEYLTKEIQNKIKRYVISSEDVYISIAGTIGLTGLIPKELDGANLTENAAKICNFKNIKNKFLSLVLSSEIGQNQIRSYLGKTTQPKLALFRIKKLLVPVPPISEQRKIASILGTVDALISSYSDIIESTQRLKTGLIQKLLTKGFDHKKFLKISLHPKSISYFLPESWKVFKITDFCKIIDTPHYTSSTIDEGIPVITTADCKIDGRIDYSNVKFTSREEYEKRIQTINPDVNDVLFTREAPLGIAVLVDKKEIAVGQRIILLKYNRTLAAGEYIVSFLNSHFGQLQANSFMIKTTVERVNISDIKNFKIPLPPIEEQRKIVKMLSNIDSKISELESNKSQIQSLKKSLMQKLLTGQIRVKV